MMAKWALIVDGRVSEITDIDPAGRFHESLQWEPCNDSIEPGWEFANRVFVPPVPIVLTPEQIEVNFSEAIQQRLDGFARTRNYDGILSACTYATSTVAKFKAEGQACVNLRDATWSAAYDILTQVQAGTRPMPGSIADIEADLPVLTWPA